MSKHYANASWEGNLAKGNGKYTLPTSKFQGNVRFATRFEDDKSASSPEELIGAALSSCYSMALAHALDQAGHKPEKIETEATVSLEKTDAGFTITDILLKTKGKVGGIDNKQFAEIAEKTKQGCPVSRALKGGPNIRLETELF
jgi:osmotically inducible protein OsmC